MSKLVVNTLQSKSDPSVEVEVSDLISASASSTDDLNEGVENIYYTENRANSAIDARVTKGFIDGLEVNAATLGGQPESYYLPANQKAAAGGVASLDANAKVPLVQIPDSVLGQLEYQGVWNADTNTPTIPPTPTKKGLYWVTSVAGDFDGKDFEVGDWIVSNGAGYDKVDNTDAVSSVHGRTGHVTSQPGDYNTDQVTEGSNSLYHTVARVLAVTLAGISFASSAAITASDSVVSSLGKIQGKLNTLKAMAFRDEATNAAALAGTGNGGMTPPLVHAAFKQFGLGEASNIPAFDGAVTNGFWQAAEEATDFGSYPNFIVITNGDSVLQIGASAGESNELHFRKKLGGGAGWQPVRSLYHTGNFNPGTKANAALDSYTVATAPSASARTRQTIYISNESGGSVPAFSDGTNWLRVTDRAVIS